jgi:TrmH family RNA methyltransferase
MRIDSRQNPLVKEARALADRKARRESGLFAAEGTDVLAMALEAGWPPVRVFCSGAAPADLLTRAEASGAVLHPASAAVMTALSAMENPPPVISVFAQRRHPLPDPATARGVWLMLDRLRNPGNVGTIVRTAHAVAASGIILVEPSCGPFAPESARASMGSLLAVPIATAAEAQALDLIRGWRGDTLALAMDGDRDFRRAAALPCLLVAGSEDEGVSPALAAAAGRRVALPMPGGTESLNVSAATAVMLYQVAFPASA